MHLGRLLAEARVARAAVMHASPQGPTSLGDTPHSHRVVLSNQDRKAPPQLPARESLVKAVTPAFVLPVRGQLKHLPDVWTYVGGGFPVFVSFLFSCCLSLSFNVIHDFRSWVFLWGQRGGVKICFN